MTGAFPPRSPVAARPCARVDRQAAMPCSRISWGLCSIADPDPARRRHRKPCRNAPRPSALFPRSLAKQACDRSALRPGHSGQQHPARARFPSRQTQNQLHIHISCIDPAVKKTLARMADRIGPSGRYCRDRRRPSLHRPERFHAVLAHGARHDCGEPRRCTHAYGRLRMALTAVPGVGPICSATRATAWPEFGSAEELESHACGVLPGFARFGGTARANDDVNIRPLRLQ